MRVAASLMLGAGLVVVLAVGLAALTYLRLEPTGIRGWLPLAFRALAWSALGLLILNLSCPVAAAPRRPLVLLDASLSLGAAGGRWREALDSARRWGEVLEFGDEQAGSDSVPTRGRSLLGPALVAASASDRPVVVVTDGEIEDAGDIPPDLLARTGVRVFPRVPRADVALTSVLGPSRVTAGDTIALEVEIQAVDSAVDSAAVEVRAGNSRVATKAVRLQNGSGRARISIASTPLGTGERLLRVSLAGGPDAEPRTDTRLHLVTVAPTPGVVFLAGPGDWDARFLYRTLRDVAQLPVRGYVRLDAERWRSMSDLAPVPSDHVRQAARRADLLILKGAVSNVAEGTLAHGIWSWTTKGSDSAAVPGDWYLSAADASPVAGAFLGQPVDSFPPAVQLTPLQTGATDWVALYSQLGRRGPRHPAVIGREEGRVRRVLVGVDGLWRWAFRGGSSEQSYRAWVAATTSWLLGGADSVRGLARPTHPVVPNGRPVVFEWAGTGSPVPVAIALSEEGRQQSDTLKFDGAGRAALWLRPGEYRYRLTGGGSGTVAVEQYSDELLPRPLTLTAREGRAPLSAGRSAARDWLWLFGLCILALSGEWFARRRLGLR
jgi:hypothetical protein